MKFYHVLIKFVYLRPGALDFIQKKGETAYLQLPPYLKWSGRKDSNLRPPAPKAGALTGLRYTPY